MFFERLEDLVSPVLVHCLLGDSVDVEQRLHCLWAEEVVTVKWLEEVRVVRNYGLIEGGRVIEL